jgi:hypothetical protein
MGMVRLIKPLEQVRETVASHEGYAILALLFWVIGGLWSVRVIMNDVQLIG